MSDALDQLKQRLAKITDLERISRVLSWDHQTMMPPAGSEHRAEHLATLRRISHELLVDDETGRLLDELRPLEESLEPDSDDGALLRLVRRDYEKAVRVPTELRAEMTRAAARARPVWVKARAESDFQQFLPALERNVELRQRIRLVLRQRRGAVRHPARRLRAADDHGRGARDVRRAQARADRADRGA